MKKLVLALTMSFLGSTAWAVGDAGCGLGSVVISKNSKLLQLFAGTTNGTFFSQTLGITFGTSNCSSSGIVMNDKQIEYFVEVNQKDLSREMAQGHGDKLAALAALHGCSSDATIQAFSQKSQAHFQEILPAANTNAVDMVRNLKAISMADVCQGNS